MVNQKDQEAEQYLETPGDEDKQEEEKNDKEADIPAEEVQEGNFGERSYANPFTVTKDDPNS